MSIESIENSPSDLKGISQQAIKKALAIAKTQANLADKAGLSQAAISKLLAGKSITSVESAIKIEAALNGKVSRHEFRPDIFGDAVKGQAA